MNSVLWMRIVQALLLLVCLLATAALCYVGAVAWKRADSRGKRVKYILFGSGLGLLFGISLSAFFLMQQMMTRGIDSASLVKTVAQYLCCSVVPAFMFAAAVIQFLWLRKYRHR